MNDTTRLRVMFQVYREVGDACDAAELASHIPALLDVIETQQDLIARCAGVIEGHLRQLEALTA